MSTQYLDLRDFLAIAAMVLKLKAEEVVSFARLHLAVPALDAPAALTGLDELYADLPTKAAVLCSRLCRSDALPRANEAVGYVCMLEFLERNGRAVRIDDSETPQVAALLRKIARRETVDEELAQWIRARLN